MTQAAGLSVLSGWQNFYMITGTAAATLTGLMFVATTLMAGIESQVSTLNAGLSAFTTPTMAHFGAVLLLSVMLSAPWQAFTPVSLLLVLAALGLVAYFVIVMGRMRRVPDYQTPRHDWLWYSILPLSAYIVLLAAAVMLLVNPALALFIIGAVMIVLLFIGIHNGWDLVTFLAIERSHPENRREE